MSCPNRIDFDTDNEGPRSGDEGNLCSDCAEKERSEWAACLGIHAGMSREARARQLEAMRPVETIAAGEWAEWRSLK